MAVGRSCQGARRRPPRNAVWRCRHAGFHPVRSAHPGRTKDDRDGQVSWLAGPHRVRVAFSGPGPNGM